MAFDNWKESDTVGFLIAGRRYDFSDFNRAQVSELCDTVRQIGEETGTGLLAMPADVDLTDETGLADDDPVYCSAYIGIPVAKGGTNEPEEVPREAMLRALAAANNVSPEVWARVDEAYAAAGGKHPGDDVALRLGCMGSLPMAYLAFGTVKTPDEGGEGDFIQGQDMGQTRHETGVRGLHVVHCSYDGSSADPADVGDEAHAARAAKHPDGAYFLIARYD